MSAASVASACAPSEGRARSADLPKGEGKGGMLMPRARAVAPGELTLNRAPQPIGWHTESVADTHARIACTV